MTRPPATGARLLVDALRTQGVDTVFCVPGESYLAVLDALHDVGDAIRLIVCRHEGGAANMADAYGRLTGRPGICMVTRGPGAANAAIGVHTARQDSTPMILFVGQVARGTIDREAFQEVDFRQMFGPLAKWVGQIDDPARVSEYLSHAFHLALSGRPGPVVLALPEDMQTAAVPAPPRAPGRCRPVQASPAAADMAELRRRLAAAERPLLIVGGATWTAEAVADITAFAEANGLPAGTSFRAQDSFDNRHDHYAGHIGIAINPTLAERVRNADLLLAAGPRLGEITTSDYTLIEVPRPRQTLVHVHPGAEELGRVYQADLPINAGMPQFAAAARALPAVDGSRWAGWREQAHADYLAHLVPTASPGAVNLAEVVGYLNAVLPENAVICNGAGNNTIWVHRFYQYRRYRTQLAPTSGAMGYGVPAAVAAKLVEPRREVVCFAGDGCFLMTGQELATAIQYGAAPIVIVVNNGMYGTIRMHQEREYPERVSGTDLVNPDFAAYARAFGAHGEVVTRTEDFPAAFGRARQSGRAALIELRVDPEALTPARSLSEIRTAALRRG